MKNLLIDRQSIQKVKHNNTDFLQTVLNNKLY